MGDLEGGQSEFAFVEREYYVIFLLAKLIFRFPPPLLIIIAQSLIVEAKYCSHAPPMRNPRPFFNLFDVQLSILLEVKRTFCPLAEDALLKEKPSCE